MAVCCGCVLCLVQIHVEVAAPSGREGREEVLDPNNADVEVPVVGRDVINQRVDDVVVVLQPRISACMPSDCRHQSALDQHSISTRSALDQHSISTGS